MEDLIIAVDSFDNQLYRISKLEAHLNGGVLHRAFSIFIYNDKKAMLLQRRALHKYHSAGIWSNACCSHPRWEEDINSAVHRRLKEEMGFDCEMKEIFTFIYKAELENSITEHELDHVFIGRYNGEIEASKEEVEQWKWIEYNQLTKEMAEKPERFSVWFTIALPKVLEYIKNNNQ